MDKQKVRDQENPCNDDKDPSPVYFLVSGVFEDIEPNAEADYETET